MKESCTRYIIAVIQFSSVSTLPQQCKDNEVPLYGKTDREKKLLNYTTVVLRANPWPVMIIQG